MFRSKDFLPDLQCPLVERFCSRVVRLRSIKSCEIVEAGCGIRMFRSEDFLPDLQYLFGDHGRFDVFALVIELQKLIVYFLCLL